MTPRTGSQGRPHRAASLRHPVGQGSALDALGLTQAQTCATWLPRFATLPANTLDQTRPKGLHFNGMASKNQMTGMTGVYLVAAELTRHGFIASTTSRSARGADILVTDQDCKRAYSVQVKTNASTFNFWLLNEHAKKLSARSHLYVFVNLRKEGSKTEFFVVPSHIVSKSLLVEKKPKSTWYSFFYRDAKRYQNKWGLFGKPT